MFLQLVSLLSGIIMVGLGLFLMLHKNVEEKWKRTYNSVGGFIIIIGIAGTIVLWIN